MSDDRVMAAVRSVVAAAQQLADLPPPGPGELKDDVGFSASTDSPMRAYLADVGRYGINNVYLKAAAKFLGGQATHSEEGREMVALANGDRIVAVMPIRDASEEES